MSGLAALLAGTVDPDVLLWHAAYDVEDVQHAVEHAGWGFGHVDGWTVADTKTGLLAAIGSALAFPEWYGQNFDALADCLRDIGAGTDGVVLLWDGWGTLARTDERAFRIAVSVLRSRAYAPDEVPFAALLRGEGPDVPGLPTLD